MADTRGLLRHEAIAALRGAELIIHAGDVGRPDIPERLCALASTVAVRGHIDTQGWAAGLPSSASVRVGELRFWVLHDLSQLEVDPAVVGFAAVVHGHSHRPSIAVSNGIVFINPGSTGPRRFKLPVTLARLNVSGRTVRSKIVTLAA